MKVRLRITPPGQPPYQFEHPGPLIHIGRDPAAELAFTGPGSDSVSWRHALLEVTPEGLFLVDTGSSNGTFLGESDNRLVRSRLDAGEDFRLGYTGPRVMVLAVDTRSEPEPITLEPVRLAPVRTPARPPETKPLPLPAEERPPAVVQRGMPTGLVVGIAAAVLAAVGVIALAAWPRKTTPTEPVKQVEVAERPVDTANAPEHTSAVNAAAARAQDTIRVEPKPRPPETKIDVPAPKPKETPGESRPVGAFVAPKDGPPSLLIQRRRDPEPWGRLRDGDRIDTDYHLVSLPGYRSRVHVDSGLRLTLWGNVPQFSTFPPVNESAVALNPPPAGLDLEVVLERGRIHLMKSKDGEKRARVRFLDETWDITLSEPATEVVVELFGADLPAGSPAGAGGPVICVGLFTKGGAGSVKAGGREQKFTQPSQMVWLTQAKTANLSTMPEIPKWWTDQLDPLANREVGLAMLALTEYHEVLSKNDDLVDTVLTRVKESSDPSVRTLGVSFLAAMDALPHVLIALESRHSEVRAAAAVALQRWIGRGPDQRAELLRALQARGGYSKEKADIILRLLQHVPRSEAQSPNGFATLVGYLTHDNLAIRELALENLELLAPATAKAIAYDPDGDAAARQKAADEWKRRGPAALADGK